MYRSIYPFLVIGFLLTQPLTLHAQISGCTDPQSTNYNPSATINNGSCTYTTINLPLTQKANISTPLIDESSGLAFLNQKLWTHNDSGGQPSIYRIDTSSSTVSQTVQITGASNVDWEDLASGPDHLFIGDFGNNNGNRTNLRIYRVSKSSLTTTATSVTADVINFSFSDQTIFTSQPTNHNFDCESIIFYNDSIHLFSKNWVDKQTKHYVLPNQAGTHVAQLRETFNAGCLVTGAAIQDLGVIVLLGYEKSGTYPVYLWIIYDFKDGLFFNGNKRKFTLQTMNIYGQAEGIAMLNNTSGFISNERYNVSPVNIPPRLHSFDLSPYLPAKFVLPKPTSAFTASVTTICQGGQTNFTDQSQGTVTSRQWLFPGGQPASSTAQNPQVIYSTSGNYNVILITGNAAGYDTLIKPAYISVQAPPLVSFTGLDASYLITQSPVTLTGSPTGGTFSGQGMSGNTFTPAIAGVGGPYNITYTYSNGIGCTNNSVMHTTVINCTVPAKPGTVTATGGNTKVCPGDVKTYSIAAVSNATSYSWTPPIGGTVTSGQGTTSATITYNNGFVANDSLRVSAVNICGGGAWIALSIKRNTPATPSAITGPAAGVCNLSGVNYFATYVAGMNYSWSFASSGASISGGQGTASVTAAFTSTYISGNIIVTASNSCGTSTARTLSVKSVPATPTSITGSVSVCTNQTSVAYSTIPISATNYTWVAPTGSIISDGVTISTGTTLITTATSVTVNFGTASGTVKVRGNNSCGSGSYRSKTVSITCRVSEESITQNFSDFKLSPNPANDFAELIFSADESGIAQIRIYDLAGRLYLTEEILFSEGLNQFQLQLNEIPAGMYLLDCELGNSSKKIRFVKQ